MISQLKDKAQNMIRQWDGKLTRELLLEPGKYGLGKLPKRLQPEKTTTMVCGFCSTGCGLNIHLKDKEAFSLTPTTDYPVNLGMACPKGWEALTPLKSPDRASTPFIRNSAGKMVACDWGTALDTFCSKFKSIQEKHGPESVAFLSTGQIVTEEMFYLGALAKFGMGMVHGDGNTRQCMATAVVSYKQSFGFDAPPYTYQDFEESDTIILVGSNMCIAHPIMWERICRNQNNPKVIVVDPRKTETAMAASDHYDILPKSDLVFFYAIAHELIKNNWIDIDMIENHLNGFESFKAHVSDYSPEMAEKISGISAQRIRSLALDIHKGKKVSFWWTMGVNQSHEGVRVAQSIINLALITGNIGRPGTGANSITGQCNAMGSRLFSNTTNLLGGHDFSKDIDREKVASELGIDSAVIQQEPGLAYDQIIEGISADKIKGLWIIATNSAHSWINQSGFKEIIKKLDFLVVQDMYHTTETAEHADLILPAAGWGEKDGTFINSERRIGLVKKVAKAPGQALSDFNIFKLIQEKWNSDVRLPVWETPEDIFQSMKRLSAGQPCDFSCIEDYRHLDKEGGIQWPYTPEDFKHRASEAQNNDDGFMQRRLFEDRQFYHEDKKAKLLFEAPQKMPEPVSDSFPFLLMTGRGSSAQWHTQTRTSKSKVLQQLYPQDIYAEINIDDATRLNILPNEQILVQSRRGKIKVTAYITSSVKSGHIFIPMHYKLTNQLTFPSFDAYSRQPSYKSCAVDVRRLEYWES